MASKVKRVVGIVLIAVAAWIALLLIVSTIRNSNIDGGYTPIDQITGIYASAMLKPGCIVEHGEAFSSQDGGGSIKYSLGPVITVVDGDPSVQSGRDARDIKIIDVYGDKCTIIFSSDDPVYNYEFFCEDYPLDNLVYNPLEVYLANDNIKTKLQGTGYTIPYSPHFPRTTILLIPVTVVPGVILLLVSLKQDKRKKQE